MPSLKESDETLGPCPYRVLQRFNSSVHPSNPINHQGPNTDGIPHVGMGRTKVYVITSFIPVILGATMSVGISLLVGHSVGVNEPFAFTEQ